MKFTFIKNQKLFLGFIFLLSGMQGYSSGIPVYGNLPKDSVSNSTVRPTDNPVSENNTLNDKENTSTFYSFERWDNEIDVTRRKFNNEIATADEEDMSADIK